MIRTVISLDPEDKAWLDRTAKQHRVPMTRIVQRAIRHLRLDLEAKPNRFETLLRKTAGMGTFGDGLVYQRKLRREWDGR